MRGTDNDTADADNATNDVVGNTIDNSFFSFYLQLHLISSHLKQCDK